MVDDVFLNGTAKGAPEVAEKAGRAAAEGRGIAAGAAACAAKDSVNAPIAMFSRHNGGWTVVFSIADPTLGISWRMGEAGDFRETGFIDTLDPRTRKRMPNPRSNFRPMRRPPPSRCAMSTPMATCRARSRSGSIRKPP